MTVSAPPRVAQQRSVPRAVIGTSRLSATDWDLIREQGEILYEAGFAPRAERPSQVIALILRGQELGVPATVAVANLTIFPLANGKGVAVRATAELTRALIFDRYGPEAFRFVDPSDDKVCTVEYQRPEMAEPSSYTYTWEEAERSGALDQGTEEDRQLKERWPAAWLRARCTTAVGALAFPDLLTGLDRARDALPINWPASTATAAQDEPDTFWPTRTGDAMIDEVREKYEALCREARALDLVTEPLPWEASLERIETMGEELHQRVLAKRNRQSEQARLGAPSGGAESS